MQLDVVRGGAWYATSKWFDWMAIPLTGTVRRYVSEINPDTGKEKLTPKITSVPCYRLNPEGDGAVFLAGLLPRLQKAAEAKGVTVTVQDARTPNPMHLVPDLTKIPESLRYKQDEVINKIIDSDKGIVTCTTGFGKSYILSVMCMIYGTARIVICTAARNVVDELYTRLSDMLGKAEVGCLRAGTHSCEDDKRVVVATCRSLSRAPLEKCDFLFFDEVHNVGFNQVFDQISMRIGHARMFGFTASPKRSDGGTDAILSLFGEKIADCSYQEAVEHHMVTPIWASMPEFKNTYDIPVTGTQVIDERLHYWARSFE